MLRLLGAQGSETRKPRHESVSAKPSDPLEALAQRAVTGDTAAQRTLLVAVGPATLQVVRRVLGAQHPDVDDVWQEATIGLLSALPKFRGESTVLHFACRVTVLTSLAARRRGGRTRSDCPADRRLLDELADCAPSPMELLHSARRREAMRELLDELSLAQAEALTLHVVLGYTVEETAALTGATPNTVRSQLRRGLDALREEFSSNVTLRELLGESHEW